MRNFLLPDIPLLQAGPEPALSALPRQFRVSVWNFQKEKRPLWKPDFLALCARSDLFLAQETRLTPSCADAVLQSGLHWHAAVSFLSARHQFPTGIAIGCRAPAQEVAYDASVHEPLFFIPKMLMRAVYPMAHTRLLVINVHAVNFSGLAPFKRHLERTARLAAAFPGPVLVAGDFNTWSQKRHDQLLLLAQRLGLQETPFQPDLRTRYLRHTVDYIFTRGLDTVSSSVETMQSSDHRPLTAVFRLR